MNPDIFKIYVYLLQGFKVEKMYPIAMGRYAVYIRVKQWTVGPCILGPK